MIGGSTSRKELFLFVLARKWFAVERCSFGKRDSKDGKDSVARGDLRNEYPGADAESESPAFGKM